MCNNPKVDLAKVNAYIKFGEILPIGSQDIEKKRNFGIKGHNSGTNFGKMTCWFLLLYVPSQQLWSLRDGQFT